MKMFFEGKPIVVTGATSGIGRSVAVHMAQRGARVLAVGRDHGRLDAVRSLHSNIVPFSVDLTQDGAPEEVLNAARSNLGGVRGLVQAAGVFDAVPLEKSNAETLDRQWAINVRAPYLLTCAALPELWNGGSVVFLSSLSAKIGFAGESAYAATKGAIEAMTKALAVELGPRGIRVNAVAPGWIQTPMNQHLLDDATFRELTVASVPSKRLGTPEDVAAVVAALLSDEFSYVTGVSIRITGGYPAPP